MKRTLTTPYIHREIELPWIAVGALSAAVGTIIAVSSIPSNILQPDALIVPALSMTLGLLIPAGLRLRGGLSSVLRAENAIAAALVYWLLLDLIQAAYPMADVERSHVETAFIGIGVFAVGSWIGLWGQSWALPGPIRNAVILEIDERALFLAIVVSFVLGMSNFVVKSDFDIWAMFAALTGDRWSTPWGRGQFGGTDAFLDHMQYFGYPLPALCVLFAKRKGWLTLPVLLALAMAILMTVFLSVSGGRRIIGVVVGAALITWVISKRSLGPHTILVLVVSTFGLLFFMQEMLRYRTVGFGSFLSNNSPELDFVHWHVDDNFYRLSQVIAIFPDFHPYVTYQPAFHALSLPIPRLLWPGKPTDPGFDLPEMIGMSGLSLSISIVGELYASFGLFAVGLGGFLYGRLSGMWNRILDAPDLNSAKPLLYGIGLMVLFVGVRSLQALVQMSYIVLAWIVVSTLIRAGRR